MTTTKRTAYLASLQERLGYHFTDISLLDCALTHKSSAHETGDPQRHYERLEFLGDAILDLIISDYLYTTYPAAQEGRLSKLRSTIVCEAGLAALAQHVELGQFLLLGRGEERTHGRRKPSLLAAAFEALIAAIYLDADLRVVQHIFSSIFGPLLTQRLASSRSQDYKGLLQKHALARYGCLPAYHIVGEAGPAHQKTFHVHLSLNQQFCATGSGPSKKTAEQRAAQQLLQQLSGGTQCG